MPESISKRIAKRERQIEAGNLEKFPIVKRTIELEQRRERGRGRGEREIEK